MNGESERLVEHTMMAVHDQLEHTFFLHQRALLDRDYPRAAAALHDYRRELEQHVHDEEQHVLPLYARLGGDATDAPLALFLGEHRNLRRFVAEFVERTAALQSAPDDRLLLDLLDREATFKNLVLHHDLRERNLLYPFLSERLQPEQQRALHERLGH